MALVNGSRDPRSASQATPPRRASNRPKIKMRCFIALSVVRPPNQPNRLRIGLWCQTAFRAERSCFSVPAG